MVWIARYDTKFLINLHCLLPLYYARPCFTFLPFQNFLFSVGLVIFFSLSSPHYDLATMNSSSLPYSWHHASAAWWVGELHCPAARHSRPKDLRPMKTFLGTFNGNMNNFTKITMEPQNMSLVLEQNPNLGFFFNKYRTIFSRRV